MQPSLTTLLVAILNLQILTTGVFGQTAASPETQHVSCKNGRVHINGTACICNTGYTLSLGKCFKTVYFTCYFTVGVIVVVFVLVSGYIMHREGRNVGQSEKTEYKIMMRFSLANKGASGDDGSLEGGKLPLPSQSTSNALLLLSNAVSSGNLLDIK